jgi:HK97 family phage portal protein
MPLPSLIQAFSRPSSRREVKGSAGAAGAAGQFVPIWGGDGQVRVHKEWDPERAILDGFEVCPWVFACITHQLQVVGRLPWVVEERQGRRDPKWLRVDDPLEELLECPNPHMSRFFFFALMVQHLGLSGNGVSKINLVNKAPDELWPLNPSATEVVADNKEWIAKYNIYGSGTRGSGRPDPLPVERVLHVQHPNPRNPLWGFAPLQSCRWAVDAENARDQWALQESRNRGVAFGAFTDPDLISEPERVKVANKLEEFFARPIGDGTRRPLVYGGNANWLRMSLTPAELERMAGRHYSVAQVAAAFSQLVALLLPDGQTYNNLATAVAHMVEHSALPVADLIRDALNAKFIPRADQARRWITYDTSGITALKRKLTEQLADVKAGTDAGIALNEMLNVAGVAAKPQTGGDVSRYPANLVEADVTDDDGGSEEDS